MEGTSQMKHHHFNHAQFRKDVKGVKGEQSLLDFTKRVDLDYNTVRLVIYGYGGVNVSTFLHLCYCLTLNPMEYYDV